VNQPGFEQGRKGGMLRSSAVPEPIAGRGWCQTLGATRRVAEVGVLSSPLVYFRQDLFPAVYCPFATYGTKTLLPAGCMRLN